LSYHSLGLRSLLDQFFKLLKDIIFKRIATSIRKIILSFKSAKFNIRFVALIHLYSLLFLITIQLKT